jgi:hypothetical protein
MTQRTAAEARKRVLTRIRADIAKYGQSVMYVGGGEDSWPFQYTIGRGRRGLPELLIVLPLRPEIGQSLLNELDRLMPEVLPSGSLVDVGGKFPVKLLDADQRAKDEYTFVASEYHGDRPYRVQLVLLCDPEGRFPPDCGAPYDRQPLLAAS